MGDTLRLCEYTLGAGYTGEEIVVGPITYISRVADWVQDADPAAVVLGWAGAPPSPAGPSAPTCDACGDTGSNWPAPNQPEPCWKCGGATNRMAHADAFFDAMRAWRDGTESVDAIVGRLGAALARAGAPPAAPTQTADPPALVDGYDATYWRESYRLLAEAVEQSLPQFIREDDVAEEAILCEAIEAAGAALRPPQEEGRPQ